MKRKLLLLSYVAAGALALAVPTAKATPIASPLHFDNGLAQAHAMRICDDDGDCWWSYRHHHRSDWDEDRDRGWRHGSRDYDEDHYGRAPHHGRDWNDRDYDRDHERHGKWDKDHERGEWGRSGEHERHGMEDKDRDKDYRRDQDKERGEMGEKNKK
jgi:hypothetical protein